MVKTDMNIRIRIVTALGLASALLVITAQAAESGFYLGGAVGQAQVTDSPPQTGGQEVSETFTPYRAFAGYRIGAIPILDFAGEIGYSNLGTANGTTAGVTTQYKAQGADASVLVIFPVLLFDFYGRVGVMRYDLDKTFNGVTTNSSGSAGYYGAGVGVRVGPIGVRLEYDRIDNKDVNSFDVGMISIYYQF
jgi:hypothetical protein